IPAGQILMREERTSYLPSYHRINDSNENDRVALLLASAALPFGIVPSIEFRGEQLVDGGVADNVPIYPLVQYESCDELVVVRLDPAPGTNLDDANEAEYVENWQRIHRMHQLLSLNEPAINFQRGPYQVCNDPPRAVPYETPSQWPKIIECRPSKP